MTQILLEPFKNLTAWTLTGTPTITTGRTGTALTTVNAAQAATYTIPAPSESDTVTMGFAYRWTDAVTTVRTVLLLNSDAAATNHLRFRVTASTGVLTVDRAGSALTGGTSAGSLFVANTWYYLEVQAKLHDTTGFVTVRRNGTNIIAITNVDTKAAGTKTVFDSVRLNSNLASSNTQWDDLYIKTGVGETFSGDITIPEGVTVNVWNGSAFVDSTAVKVWNGSSFVDATAVKVWNGSAFVDAI